MSFATHSGSIVSGLLGHISHVISRAQIGFGSPQRGIAVRLRRGKRNIS